MTQISEVRVCASYWSLDLKRILQNYENKLFLADSSTLKIWRSLNATVGTSKIYSEAGPGSVGEKGK